MQDWTQATLLAMSLARSRYHHCVFCVLLQERRCTTHLYYSVTIVYHPCQYILLSFYYPSTRTIVSSHPIHILSTHPHNPLINTPSQRTLSTHPHNPLINSPSQRTLSIHPHNPLINTPSQRTLSIHPLNAPYQYILSTHPINTSSHVPYQYTPSSFSIYPTSGLVDDPSSRWLS